MDELQPLVKTRYRTTKRYAKSNRHALFVDLEPLEIARLRLHCKEQGFSVRYKIKKFIRGLKVTGVLDADV